MKSSFDIIVNKLWKRSGKIINNSHIATIIEQIEEQTPTAAKVYKTSHNLKNKGYLMSLKKNTFLITNPKKQPDEDEIAILYYRDLLKQHCKEYLTGQRYIWWLKALEIHHQNYEVPDSIDIVNIKKNSLEVILFNKTVSYKTYTHKQGNFLPLIKKHLIIFKLGRHNFPIAPLELAMLESLHNPHSGQSQYIKEYIKKTIRKHKKTLNINFFELCLTNNKHHVGVNRIYQLAKGIDPVLADKLHTLLKKYSFIISNDTR